MLVVRSCFNKNDVFRKVHTYETFKAYLETISSDVNLKQKMIGLLPTDIHEVYIEEKEPKSKYC